MWNHNSDFPYLLAHFAHNMPIYNAGGSFGHVLFNSKCATNVYKITVATSCGSGIVQPTRTPDAIARESDVPSGSGPILQLGGGSPCWASKRWVHVVLPHAPC